METQNNTLINFIKEIIDNEPVTTIENEFNDNYTAKIFQKYTDKGATLIIGLTQKTTAPKEVDFNEQELTPKYLKAKITLQNDLFYKLTDDSFFDLITSEINKELENKFNLDNENYENYLIAVFGNNNFIIDKTTLNKENKIIIHIQLIVDVISKQNN